MSYTVSIIADSVAPHGARITTFKLTYPMLIHWDFLTHRALSRNTESGRVISTPRRIKMVRNSTFYPSWWMSDATKMRNGERLSVAVQDQCDAIWYEARDAAISAAERLHALGAHRQQANTLLIPFGFHAVVATATNWGNFFNLRVPVGAREEFRIVSLAMARQYRDSVPKPLEFGQWHLPFITDDEQKALAQAEDAGCYGPVVANLIRCSTARCARVSYLRHDGTETTMKDDLDLSTDLIASGHWSPTEHQACPAKTAITRSGNFEGWEQYRQLFVNQNRTEFDFSTLEQFAP